MQGFVRVGDVELDLVQNHEGRIAEVASEDVRAEAARGDCDDKGRGRGVYAGAVLDDLSERLERGGFVVGGARLAELQSLLAGRVVVPAVPVIVGGGRVAAAAPVQKDKD